MSTQESGRPNSDSVQTDPRRDETPLQNAPRIQGTQVLPSDETIDTSIVSPDADNFGHPGEFIGRYEIVRTLGRGGFGRVFLAEDSQLNRQVSIKVPHAHCVRTRFDLAKYVEEAQMVARLDHPGIVPVYDAGEFRQGLCFVVSKFINGETLRSAISQGKFSIQETIDVVRKLSETLQYVHEQGVVHRDIKPSNVLIDTNGNLFVNDFGLALSEPDFSERGRIIGTPAYMSPEQASGEGHLVDGRTDVFSLGVVLYEMLTGKQPFKGGSMDAVIFKIRSFDPQPIRQLNRDLPKELERVCQKAIAKRASERYATAMDFANDLQSCLGPTRNLPIRPQGKDDSASSRQSDTRDRVIVIPKGLRAYEEQDANFFRAMLPGPYDIDGCPESIRFWRSRVDPDGQSEPFRVGVIYGTSGCGKSSFVRAGLVPMLDPRVKVCIVDATVCETTSALTTHERLSQSLQRRVLDVDLAEKSIDEQFAAIRRAPNRSNGEKLLVVIDQFEQWLHSATATQREEMVRALRQCDGDRLQAILLVRDDFWLEVSRLMSELDIEMAPNRNLAMIDLLDRSHAERVLAMLGRAHGNIQSDEKIKREQKAFISDAVNLLADDDRVIAVRLALLAEIMKSRPWTRSKLREMGGIEGTVERFLYESFDAAAAPKDHRCHREAAIRALQTLLPTSGVIRGQPVSGQQLKTAAGYADDSIAFEQLLRILDTDLRLITPIELSQTNPSDNGGRYQLTHDSLVPAIRQWISIHQRKTAAGRAQLSLATRASAWEADPQSRQLPSFLEWIRFTLLTRKHNRSTSQQRLIQVSSMRYRRILFSGLIGSLIVFLIGYQFACWLSAESKVRQLTTATTSEIPNLVEAVQENSSWTYPRLREIRDDENESDRTRFIAALSLRDSNSESVSDETIGFLRRHLSDSDYRTLNLAKQYKPAGWQQLEQEWTNEISDSSIDATERLRAVLLLGKVPKNDVVERVSVDVGESSPEEEAPSLGTSLIAEAQANRLQYPDLIELCRPIGADLAPLLLDEANNNASATRQEIAVLLLSDLFAESPSKLCEVFVGLSTPDLKRVLPALEPHGKSLESVLRRVCDQQGKSSNEEQISSVTALRHAHAAALSAKFGNESPVWKVFSSLVNDEPNAQQIAPETPSYLTQIMPDVGCGPETLLRQLETTDNTVLRRNLLLTIGDYYRKGLAEKHRRRIQLIAREVFKMDPNAGVHAAAWWLLIQLKEHDWLTVAQTELSKNAKRNVLNLSSTDSSSSESTMPLKEWIVTPSEITMVRLDGRDHSKVGIEFEIGAVEISRRQFREFKKSKNRDRQLAEWDEDAPAGIISWHEAAAFCNWLTEQEIGEDEKCYPPIQDSTQRVDLLPDYRTRQGFRLPTSAEWDFAWESDPQRVAATTNPQLRSEYGLLLHNAGKKSHPPGIVKPDRSGLFHLTGNSLEWTSDRRGDHYLVRGASYRSEKPRPTKDKDAWFVPTINWRAAGFRVVRSVVEKGGNK